MGRPLDEMDFTVIRHPGAWTDGPWVPLVPLLTAQVNGDPTPVSTATLDDVTAFVPTEYAVFYNTAGVILGSALIVSINGGTKVITFATGSLTWDAEIGDRVAPSLVFKASRPQPVGPEQIEMLPEGARTSARFIVYAADDQPELYLVEPDQVDFAADRVLYNSKTYVVTTTDDWSDMPLGYLAYILLAFAPDEKVPS